MDFFVFFAFWSGMMEFAAENHQFPLSLLQRDASIQPLFYE
jgi:hypothetical protein